MEEDNQAPPLDLRSLKALSVLGRGAKGVTFLVRNRFSNETLALKSISKSSIEKKTKAEYGIDGYRRIWFERDVLKMLQHPLLPKLQGFLVTEKIVGFAIEYCSGGDLNTLRKRQSEKMFSDEVIRFYAAELVLALEYLHGLGIVYRDLKPENVLIQNNGHLMLVDFDLSTKLSPKSLQNQHIPSKPSKDRSEKPVSSKKRRFRPLFLCNAGFPVANSAESESNTVRSVGSNSANLEKSNSFVGTEDYVAPEIISGKGHDFAVDWWGLGVLLYEMLYGRTPFRGGNRKETFYRILTKEAELVGQRTALKDLIRRLLEKDPGNRISLEGIKDHEFFRGLDWELIIKIARPPFIPPEREDERQEMEEIDVEEFVAQVFHVANVENVKSLERKKNNNDNSKCVRVDPLANNPTNNPNFLVF